jgi:hypothetical protein
MALTKGEEQEASSSRDRGLNFSSPIQEAMRQADVREAQRRRLLDAHRERERVFALRHDQLIESLHQQQRLISKALQEPILDVDLLNSLWKSDRSLDSRLFHAELSFAGLQRRRREELNDALEAIEKGVDIDPAKFEAEVDQGHDEEDQEFIRSLCSE